MIIRWDSKFSLGLSIENLKYNLFSVSLLEDAGLEINVRKGNVHVMRGDVGVIAGRRIGRLYEFEKERNPKLSELVLEDTGKDSEYVSDYEAELTLIENYSMNWKKLFNKLNKLVRDETYSQWKLTCGEFKTWWEENGIQPQYSAPLLINKSTMNYSICSYLRKLIKVFMKKRSNPSFLWRMHFWWKIKAKQTEANLQ